MWVNVLIFCNDYSEYSRNLPINDILFFMAELGTGRTTVIQSKQSEVRSERRNKLDRGATFWKGQKSNVSHHDLFGNLRLDLLRCEARVFIRHSYAYYYSFMTDGTVFKRIAVIRPRILDPWTLEEDIILQNLKSNLENLCSFKLFPVWGVLRVRFWVPLHKGNSKEFKNGVPTLWEIRGLCQGSS